MTAKTVSSKIAKASTAKAIARDSLRAIDPGLKKEALLLDKKDVLPLRANPTLARVNVQRAIKAVLAKRTEIEARVKKPNFAAVLRLEAVVDAVDAASRAVQQTAPMLVDHDADLARLWVLRALLLSLAELLASANVLPARSVEAIRSGQGNLDAARDLIDLTDLFNNHANEVRGKMGPVSDVELTEAKDLGTRLLATIRPKKSKDAAPVDAPRQAAVDLRDRLHTLLYRDYEMAFFLGAAAYGSRVEQHVRPLGSGQAKGALKTKKPVNL